MRNKSVTCWGLRAVRSAREGSAVSFSCISVRLSSTAGEEGTDIKRDKALIFVYPDLG